MSFFEELKRRNVFRVGIAYGVASWLLLQLTEVLTELLEIGPEVGKIVIVLLIVGLIPALIFAWAFEMTPEGIKRESEIDRSTSITPHTGRKLDRFTIAMLVLVAGYFIWESRFKTRTAQPAPAEVTVAQAEAVTPEPVLVPEPIDVQKSIVVLPFVNMSNDPDQEFFSDGLSEEILNALVKIQDLRVISRTSAFAFKGKDVSIPDIAAQLDVSHVLEGSVRKAGNDVRITAQLIEVATDSHLWSEAYNRSLENVFEIQEEISVAIANELQVTLGTGQARNRPTDNIQAYQEFLRGRHLYQDRGGEQLDQAIVILKNVVATEPDYADAWANLAGASVVRSFQMNEGFAELIEQGRQAAEKAIAIDPENGFGHAVLGLLHLRAFEWDDAMTALDRAIELNPNESNSYLWKGIGLNALGYHREALKHLLQAESVDPIWGLLQSWIGITYTAIGDAGAVQRHALKERDIALGTTAGEMYRYEMLMGNMQSAEQEWSALDMLDIETDLFVKLMFETLRNPESKTASIQTMLENEKLAGSRVLFPYLWRIGAAEEGIASLMRIIETGRGLRVQISFIEAWNAYNREYLSSPHLHTIMERSGMADYWRRHGNPDLCRVTADSIECGEP